MELRVILCMMFLSFNLLTGAESPVSEKRSRINHIEYNEILKSVKDFLRKPPYLLITKQLTTSHSKYVEDFSTDGTQAKIGFCYDISGNRIKKSDLNDANAMSCPNTLVGVPAKDTSGRNQAYWSYDAFGKLRGESDPDLGVSFYTYNNFGDLTSSTNAKGVTTNLSYDSIGRILTKSIPEGNIAYTYDSFSGSENALGKLVRIEDLNQTKTFSYDKLGRVKKEIRTILAISSGNPLPTETQGPYITETRYDLLGRVTRIDYPEHPISHGRMRACYEYGSAGYISGISVQVNTNGILPGYCNKDIVENINYNEFGQTATVTLGNGIATSYSYDVKGRMIRLNSSGDVNGNTKVLQDAVYSFNPNNNITNISNTTTDFNTQYGYGYDGIGRLTSANGSYLGIAEGNLSRRFQQSFDYAKNGNLTSKRIHDPANGSVQDEWSYVYSNHQVTNIDSSRTGADTLTLQYDANGNLTRQRDNVKDLTKRISVDSQDRITQIQDGNNAILGTYWYDESGFRIRRSALEEKNNVFTNVEILYPSKFYGLEFIESENILTSVNNVYLNGVRIAAMNEAGALAYYLTDQVDSVSHVLDDEGNTLSQIQYQPYGETFVQRGDLNFSPKYNSQELDRESGFYFYNARYYDPGIARFTSADTIIDGEFDTQGWNRFSYVKGNPIGAKDPTGHEACTTSRTPCKTETLLGGGGGNSAGLGAAATGLLANLLGMGEKKSSQSDKPRSTSVTPNDAKDMAKSGLDPLNKADVKNFLDKGTKSGVTHGGNSNLNSSVTKAIQPFYPQNNGAIGKETNQFLYKGTMIDRYGGTDYSRFFSPAGTPKNARSLPSNVQSQELRTFEVMKPFEIKKSVASPAYGESGFGTQYRTPVPLKTLLDKEIIREVKK
ncbi:RHS repeat-associated core domain-containing protein [Leptospira santarosai]|uniref:RHS repeat-associated core domain-containing protein n=1 Tax=Leptospira santarosai TaxID=28183 RepID=UPI002277131F|nr:RHS repeat-associated core domain-containing protein [Leptospira santarosai]